MSTVTRQDHDEQVGHEDSASDSLFRMSANHTALGEASDAVPRTWPGRPMSFGELLTPVEAAQYLRLDEVGTHTPTSAIRTLDFWRGKGELRATKYARHVWYRRSELDRFLERKTET